MSDVAIRVEHLSKRYRIGLAEERPDTLVGAARSWLGSPLQNVRRLRRLTAFDNGRTTTEPTPRAGGEPAISAPTRRPLGVDRLGEPLEIR